MAGWIKIEDLMVFLSNFELTRPGIYAVSQESLLYLIGDFIETGTLTALNDFDLIIHSSWEDEFSEMLIDEDKALRVLSIAGDQSHMVNKTIHIEAINDAVAYAKNCLRYYENQRTYAAKRKQACTFTQNKDVREAVFARDGHKCKHCGSGDRLTVDHILAVKNGGGNEQENFQTLCRPCNSKKGAK